MDTPRKGKTAPAGHENSHGNVPVYILERFGAAQDAADALMMIEASIGVGDKELPATWTFTYQGVKFTLIAEVE